MVEFSEVGEDGKEKILKKYLNKKIELSLISAKLRNKRMKKITGILKGFYHGQYKEVILEQPKQQTYIKLVVIDNFKVLD